MSLDEFLCSPPATAAAAAAPSHGRRPSLVVQVSAEAASPDRAPAAQPLPARNIRRSITVNVITSPAGAVALLTKRAALPSRRVSVVVVHATG
ncbi:MAG: hypothetical protein P4N59_33045 [Negativicutes bacterium]|nr:hypothetical protein [Negativicutes bacterium]